ncbi:DNA-directed RNA polymerase subunit delta [Spiroplasma endosymbiont of 'Nebria riversi']|uniref:DNA-directed RNA polymerase subunit delta n=1 Tax=Spiroplasma endosymbiont of 'Nebria riversi' TaxID=2792084 RepID=UPI001C040122|nr:DNA-directed RNA polymerase subunit delta [Spiroplasma endosymbiont of 'Nebria riversi']
MNKSLVDLAYEFLIKRKHAGFKEIYDYVKIAKETTIESETKEMVNLYTDMVLDNRFLLIQDNEWGLRQDYKFDEIKKQLEFLFAINDDIDPKKLEVTEIIDEVDNTFEESIDDEEDELEIDSDDEVDWDEIEKEMEENN